MSQSTIDPEIAGRIDLRMRLIDLILDAADFHDGNVSYGFGTVIGHLIHVMEGMSESLDEVRNTINLVFDNIQEIRDAKARSKNLH